MVTKPKNDTEAAAMRDVLAGYEREKAQADYDAAVEALKPLTDFVASKPFATVVEQATALRAQYADRADIDPHLLQIPVFMERLRAAAEAGTRKPFVLLNDAAAAPGE